jgi:hypothetical protein
MDIAFRCDVARDAHDAPALVPSERRGQEPREREVAHVIDLEIGLESVDRGSARSARDTGMVHQDVDCFVAP